MYDVLINKNNKLPENLNFEIVKTDSKYALNIYAEKNTFKNFKKLQTYIFEKYGFVIDIESGYRSIEKQEKLFNEICLQKGLKHTLKYVAKPGYSEHNSGLAIDITLFDNGRFLVDFEFSSHEIINIIEKNAHKFGFIIRYPKNKEYITGYGYEPWHLRYVGKKIAKYIYNHNITLEEYKILTI